MSIFKDTFRPYVRKQLSLREELINIGNTDDRGIRSDRLSANKIGLQTGESIELQAGAYNTYTLNKQCVIRMTSMVDYVENVNLEIGGLEGAQSFNALRGAALSQNFILEGGVLSDFARVRNGKREVRRVTTPRDSFPRPGQTTNLGYGDLAIGADASSDGYGIVPMPGIIDINVRTKSAYGSLREAKVNFECHNRRQLEVLEMLYMRPGYMVVLEWGWTPYVGNDGKIKNERRLLEDITDGRIYTNNITQQEVFSYINKLKEEHNGNYDGFLGFVKNFGFQAREDGGFSCYTELISIGEVIESLKIPNISITDPAINIPSEKGEVQDESNIRVEYEKPGDSIPSGNREGTTSESRGPGTTLYVDKTRFNQALEAGVFPRYNGLLGLVKSLHNYCVFNNFSRGNSNNERNVAFENQQLDQIFKFTENNQENAASDEQKESLETQNKVAKDLASESDYTGIYFQDYLKSLARYQSTSLERYLLNTLQLTVNSELLNYIIPIGGKAPYKPGEDNKDRARSTQCYIRWDALCVLINENLITKDEKANNPIKIVADRIYDNGDRTSKLDPLLLTPISDYTKVPTNNLLDFSCDSNICILPLQFETNTLADVGGNIDAYQIEDSLGYIPDTSVFPVNYTAATFNKGLPIYYNGQEIRPDLEATGPPNPTPLNLTSKDRLRRIGSIFLNINMLNDIAEKNADTDDYTLGKFLNDIWGEVNKACPNHNFVVTDDKESNVIFVIDLPVDNSEVPLDLHTFIPFSNKNILRKFEYTSNVPKAMSATIAIQSQDPRSIQDIDGVTFAAFNRSIKNRLLSEDASSNWDKTKNAISNNEDSILDKQNQLRQQLDRHILRFFPNIRLTSNDKDPVTEGNIAGILKEYQKNAAYLSTAVTATSTFNSVIPLEFSATLDGISGIVIGNMFKVQKDRLPKAYERANIGFIVFNEDQKVSGQDWTTDISGKMTILPTPSNKPIISGISSTTYTDSPILNETAAPGVGSATKELAEGQDAPTDIAQATDGEPVFLKKIKDNSILGVDIEGIGNIFTGTTDYAYFGRRPGDNNDLPVTTFGKTIGKTHGFTTVRSTPEVDNKNPDNIRGMFNSWEDGGMLLGVIKAGGIKEVKFDEGRIRLLPSKYGDYFDLDSEDVRSTKLISFTPEKQEGNTTVTLDGVAYYVITKPLKENTDMKDIRTPGEMILSNDTETKRYIRVSDCSDVASVWYSIQFDVSADDKFHNGWAREGAWLDPTGAGDALPRNNQLLSEFSKTNDCWMRFDTLAATAASATGSIIIEDNDEFPETTGGPQ